MNKASIGGLIPTTVYKNNQNTNLANVNYNIKMLNTSNEQFRLIFMAYTLSKRTETSCEVYMQSGPVFSFVLSTLILDSPAKTIGLNAELQDYVLCFVFSPPQNNAYIGKPYQMSLVVKKTVFGVSD